jgi:sRNA-binding protein
MASLQIRKEVRGAREWRWFWDETRETETHRNPWSNKEIEMYRKFMKTVTWALAILLVSSTLALAAGQKASGTVVAVQKEVVIVQGADGKTFEIEAVKVVELNLKTGDLVEYEIIEGKPVNINKATKK